VYLGWKIGTDQESEYDQPKPKYNYQIINLSQSLTLTELLDEIG
jgi:hypothetical protein